MTDSCLLPVLVGPTRRERQSEYVSRWLVGEMARSANVPSKFHPK